MKQNTDFEVIIIGGSYAGLSAAMALGRSLRRVLIIDGGQPCNIQTPHSHNFITQDGETPAAIAAKAKKQVMAYPTVKFLEDFAISGKKSKDGFSISIASGETFQGKKLVLASGIKDIMPDIKGFAECWGISVVHCPYCHGYELRGKNTAIMANSERAFHLATLVNSLTGKLTILSSGKADFKPEQFAKLKEHNIEIIETPVLEVAHHNGLLAALILKDGIRFELDAMYAALPFIQHSDIPVSLGCELSENGFIKIDGFQRTNISGIYACGDNVNMMRSVANAVYSGNITGAMVNKELTEESF